jgi:hypothetical protein
MAANINISNTFDIGSALLLLAHIHNPHPSTGSVGLETSILNANVRVLGIDR